ncbi:MAG TPA: hypothetical protein VND68_07250 [Chloroflexia bacterium]|nr:hypothetical protein [Chloroflexia bacterium]
MPIRHSLPIDGNAKAKIKRNKERPIEAGDGRHSPGDIEALPSEKESFPPHQAAHTQAPPETLNAPAVPLSPLGTLSDVHPGTNSPAPIDTIDPSTSPGPTVEVPSQEPLEEPTSRQGIITVGGIDFHHASEAEFARLLNYYGIDWQYEPHQFPLQWRDGRPVEMFRPDFYLTEYDMYIELTTMRQALVRRKNRKLRLLRALYPEINIKLLYRRDYQRLLERFGIRQEEFEAEAPVSLQEVQDEVAAEARVVPELRQEDIA